MVSNAGMPVTLPLTAACAPRAPRSLCVAASHAPKALEGKLTASGMRFGVVVGRFNDLVTKLLLEGCMSSLER